MSNKDKDIEILKEFTKKDYEPWSFYEKQGDELFELQEAIENVLSELETYKKIAKKLAEDLSNCIEPRYAKKYCNGEWNCLDKKEMKCKQCIIDWARKEVEKDE